MRWAEYPVFFMPSCSSVQDLDRFQGQRCFPCASVGASTGMAQRRLTVAVACQRGMEHIISSSHYVLLRPELVACGCTKSSIVLSSAADLAYAKRHGRCDAAGGRPRPRASARRRAKLREPDIVEPRLHGDKRFVPLASNAGGCDSTDHELVRFQKTGSS